MKCETKECLGNNTVTTVMEKERTKAGAVGRFMENNFKHFNARETLDAARAFKKHGDDGGKMFLAMAGAMSTGELGISLARMIRDGKIHAISSTAANLEEDLFNLLAHDDYKMVSGYRDLTPGEELALRDKGFNRVTDTCIPEDAMRKIEKIIIMELCVQASKKGERYFPWEYIYQMLTKARFKRIFTPLWKIPGFTRHGKRGSPFTRQGGKTRRWATFLQPVSWKAKSLLTPQCVRERSKWSIW